MKGYQTPASSPDLAASQQTPTAPEEARWKSLTAWSGWLEKDFCSPQHRNMPQGYHLIPHTHLRTSQKYSTELALKRNLVLSFCPGF